MKTARRRARRRQESAVKQRLLAYRDLNREIDNTVERIENLEDKMYFVGSPTLSDMPKASTVEGDKIGKMVSLHEELKERVRNLIALRTDECKWISGLASRLKDPDEKAVIEMRYIDVESWSKVSKMLFGGDEDFEEKSESYLRRCHKLHGRALANLERITKQDEEL